MFQGLSLQRVDFVCRQCLMMLTVLCLEREICIEVTERLH